MGLPVRKRSAEEKRAKGVQSGKNSWKQIKASRARIANLKLNIYKLEVMIVETDEMLIDLKKELARQHQELSLAEAWTTRM